MFIPPNNKEKQSFVAVHPLRTNDCVFQELLEFIVPLVVDFSDTPKSAAIGGVPLVCIRLPGIPTAPDVVIC